MKCLTCQDTGKILKPYYGDFAPRLEWCVCPDCHPVIEIRNRWIVGIVVVGFVIWLVLR